MAVQDPAPGGERRARGAALRVLVCSPEPPQHVRGFLRRAAPLRGGARNVELLWGPRPDAAWGAAEAALLERADLVVLHRPCPEPQSRALLQALFGTSRPVLCDLDELSLELPPQHPGHARTEANRSLLLEVLSRADALSCASPALAALLGTVNPDASVLPDTVPDELLERAAAPRPPGPLTLGCLGSPEHATDLEHLEPALLALKQRFGRELRFCLVGCSAPRLAALPDTLCLPAETDHARHLRQLAELRLDLAAVPLRDTLFDRCRSPLPWLELSALGVPGAYADLEPYRAALQHGHSGWLCPDDPDAWHASLAALLDDPDLRTRLAVAARAQVHARHTRSAAAPLFAQTYERVAALRRPPGAQRSLTPGPGRDCAPAAGPTGDSCAAAARSASAAAPRSSIVIPVFGRAELTEQCLRALFACPARGGFEVIVVDNASPDDTPAVLARWAPRIRVLRNAQNLGFAAACNQGARAARGDALVFLNNDTIPQPGWLDALLDALELPGVQLAGSRLLYPDGRIQHAGVAICSAFGTPYHVFQGTPGDLPAVNRRRELHMITGACMAAARPLFEALGGFDEAYRNSFEDIDLCLRARLRGARVLYEPRSWLYHLESQTPGRHQHDDHNLRLFKQRWSDLRWWDEAAQYATAGVYRSARLNADDSVSHSFSPIRGPLARAAWWRVSWVQRRLIEDGFAALEPLLEPPPLWPAEPNILDWAARLCLAHDRPERARRLRAHREPDAATESPRERSAARMAPAALSALPSDSWAQALRAQLHLL